MKRTLKLIVAVALAGTACADVWEIQLFWSTTGINDPNWVYNAAETNFLPYFVPPTPVYSLPAGTYDLFLWGQVTDPNDLFFHHPEGARIYGINLGFGGDATYDVSVAYCHRKLPPGAYRRWGQCCLPLNAPLGALSHGITFVPYPINDLYRYQFVDFLVGAARITGDAGEYKTMSLDGIGIGMRDLGSGEDIPDPPVLPALVTFVARGDLNCDGVVDFDDINPFVLALSDPAAYAAAYPTCNILTGDCDQNGQVDFDDINPFVALLGGQ
jgi:hypothetical protein